MHLCNYSGSIHRLSDLLLILLFIDIDDGRPVRDLRKVPPPLKELNNQTKSNCIALLPTKTPWVVPTVYLLQTELGLRNRGLHSDPNGKDKACSRSAMGYSSWQI